MELRGGLCPLKALPVAPVTDGPLPQRRGKSRVRLSKGIELQRPLSPGLSRPGRGHLGRVTPALAAVPQ